MARADSPSLDEKQKLKLLRVVREYDKLADAAARQTVPSTQ